MGNDDINSAAYFVSSMFIYQNLPLAFLNPFSLSVPCTCICKSQKTPIHQAASQAKIPFLDFWWLQVRDSAVLKHISLAVFKQRLNTEVSGKTVTGVLNYESPKITFDP